MKRLALLTVLAVTLAGCSAEAPDAGPTEADDVVAVETAFLDALVDGDGEAALALTTLDEDDLTCAAMVTDFKTLRLGIVLAEVGTASVDDDAATVDFSYSVAASTGLQNVSGTHTLVRDGDSWLIEFPDEYRINATLGQDVVGQAGIMPTKAPFEPYQCLAPAVDGVYEVIALPGRYAVITSDPTEVFYNSEYATVVSVYDNDSAEPEQPQELTYITDENRDLVANHIREALEPYIDLCAASGFTDPTCQDGLPVPQGPVTAPDRLPLDGVEIFSEDGLTWKFRAGGEDYLFQGANGIEKFEVYYSGTVSSDGTLYHQIALD